MIKYILSCGPHLFLAQKIKMINNKIYVVGKWKTHEIGASGRIQVFFKQNIIEEKEKEKNTERQQNTGTHIHRELAVTISVW